MAYFRVLPIAFLVSTLIPDTVEAAYCYYVSYSYYYTYYCSYYVPVGSIAGGVIGALIGLATLIVLIVYFCCIRPRRLAATGTVLQPGVTTFATTTGVSTMQMGGGYVNPVAYPPGTTPAYPPGTTPAYPPGTTPAYPPGTTPAYPPGTTPAYPPGTTPAYPQYTYPPQDKAPPTEFQPPPNYS